MWKHVGAAQGVNEAGVLTFLDGLPGVYISAEGQMVNADGTNFPQLGHMTFHAFTTSSMEKNLMVLDYTGNEDRAWQGQQAHLLSKLNGTHPFLFVVWDRAVKTQWAVQNLLYSTNSDVIQTPSFINTSSL
ncbi:hypothetical protein DFS34DRAFT_590322 [Phlyctochytrium arcticum]|nr:hypothetical protein DFS34DRAFT_590322 [Phlyctochytrium arcticum]